MKGGDLKKYCGEKQIATQSQRQESGIIRIKLAKTEYFSLE
jgi:hypothetical protein